MIKREFQRARFAEWKERVKVRLLPCFHLCRTSTQCWRRLPTYTTRADSGRCRIEMNPVGSGSIGGAKPKVCRCRRLLIKSVHQRFFLPAQCASLCLCSKTWSIMRNIGTVRTSYRKLGCDFKTVCSCVAFETAVIKWNCLCALLPSVCSNSSTLLLVCEDMVGNMTFSKPTSTRRWAEIQNLGSSQHNVRKSVAFVMLKFRD